MLRCSPHTHSRRRRRPNKVRVSERKLIDWRGHRQTWTPTHEIVIGGVGVAFGVQYSIKNHQKNSHKHVHFITEGHWLTKINWALHATRRWGQKFGDQTQDAQKILKQIDSHLTAQSELYFWHIKELMTRAYQELQTYDVQLIEDTLITVVVNNDSATAEYLYSPSLNTNLSESYYYSFAKRFYKPALPVMQQDGSIGKMIPVSQTNMYNMQPDEFKKNSVILGTGLVSLWSVRDFGQMTSISVIGRYGSVWEDPREGNRDIPYENTVRFIMPPALSNFSNNDAFQAIQFKYIEAVHGFHVLNELIAEKNNPIGFYDDRLDYLYRTACAALGYATIERHHGSYAVSGKAVGFKQRDIAHDNPYIVISDLDTVYCATGSRYNHEALNSVPARHKLLGDHPTDVASPNNVPVGSMHAAQHTYHVYTANNSVFFTKNKKPWFVDNIQFDNIMDYANGKLRSEGNEIDANLFSQLKVEFKKSANNFHDLDEKGYYSLWKEAYQKAYPERPNSAWQAFNKLLHQFCKNKHITTTVINSPRM